MHRIVYGCGADGRSRTCRTTRTSSTTPCCARRSGTRATPTRIPSTTRSCAPGVTGALSYRHPFCAIPLRHPPCVVTGSCSAGCAPAGPGSGSGPTAPARAPVRGRRPRAGAVGAHRWTGVPPRPSGGRRSPTRTPACRPGRRPAARDRALARGSGLVVPRPVPRCRIDRGRRRPPRHERHGRPRSGSTAAPDARGCLDGRADRYGCRHRGRCHHRGAVAVPAVRPSRRPRVVRTAARPTSHTRSVPNPQRATLNRDRTRPCCLLPRHRPA